MQDYIDLMNAYKELLRIDISLLGYTFTFEEVIIYILFAGLILYFLGGLLR